MRNCRFKLKHAGLIAAAVHAILNPLSAWPNPTGPQVVNGAASVNRPDASTLNVTNSPGAIINWQGFSIGANEVTRFIQSSSSSAVLNRVVGPDLSSIQGQLLSNGRVFLINPAGIVVGPNAMIDTAGFVGSTLNMQDADFIAGRLKFQGDASSGRIVNQGWIKTASGGQVILVAPQVENSGLIQTPNGQIILAAGKSLTIASLDHEGVQFEVQAPADAVLNIGKLLAEGGAIGVFAGTLKHSGEIRATSLTTDASGQIILSGSNSVELAAGSITEASGARGGNINIQTSGLLQAAGSLEASGSPGAGGNIALSGDVIIQTGEVRADGASGGTVAMQSRNLLSAGRISADGMQGAGGDINLQASNNIIQTSAARLSADGAAGDGGSVTVQAGNRVFSSTVASAIGSGGTGGTVKVLGNEIVLLGAALDASGDTGGGSVLVGGDFQGANKNMPNATSTALNFSTTLKADAGNNGTGGKIIVWSNERTDFFGQASARGGAQSGDGGFIEISGKQDLAFGGLANAGAANGKAGTLLLDPKNIIIDAAAAATGGFSTINLVDPNIGANDRFATAVVALSGGNIVATDPYDSFAASQSGAVYLYNGTTGALISALSGSSAFDYVGNNGISTLSNGNFIVSSPSWANGAALSAGAVTWGSGTTGVSGVVSAANSLVGTTASDSVGSGGVHALSNGNYVVASPGWSGTAGAVTFGNGTAGVSGAVSASNSLIGTTAGDQVGSGYSAPGITELSNGNYVVSSPNWSAATGAVTFGSGTAGTVVGAVSAANSLVGAAPNDFVSGGGNGRGITELTNGNYVVSEMYWQNGTATRSGAVTWVNGTTGFIAGSASRGGIVGVSNSLVGSAAFDDVGSTITPLFNGNYVASSAFWSNNRGAATWVNGTNGNIAGSASPGAAVSSANSLVGASGGSFADQIGREVTALFNGNYVVSGFLYSGSAQIGSVTWVNGSNGNFAGSTTPGGFVSAANSLVGAQAGDVVGYNAFGPPGVFPLFNGNYLVISSSWHSGAAILSGAVTLINGANGNIVATGSPNGAVSAANSLVGSAARDQVGFGGIVQLFNGNYVVLSPGWNKSGLQFVAGMGAVTFGTPTSLAVGAVSSANSLVGSTVSDSVGSYGVTPLFNGNYVVKSPNWTNGLATSAGAVTWGSGTTGVSGAVSATNSLVGTTAGDSVGTGVVAFSNGNYVVTSPSWANGAASSAGAVTWGSGTAGVTGAVSAGNSLVGTTANDAIGSYGVTELSNGNYVVSSPDWSNGASASAGAVTWGNGAGGTVGNVTAANSLVGTTASDRVGYGGITALSGNGNYVVISQLWNNGAATQAGAVTWGDGSTTGTRLVGAVSAANSLVGTTAGDQLGFYCSEGCAGGITALSNGNYVVSSPAWNNGAQAFAGAVTWGDGSAAGTRLVGAVTAANSYVGVTANDLVGSDNGNTGTGITPLSNGSFVVNTSTFDNGAVDTGKAVIYVPGGAAGFTNPLAFGNSAASNATITPAQITAIANTGTAVTLQANNDITLAVGSNIVTNNPGGNGGAITMQAGRSVVLNSGITTDNGNLSITANDAAALAPNRDAGAGTITMAAGTALDAGTATMALSVGAGPSASMTLGAINAGALNITHSGSTAGSGVVLSGATTVGSANIVTQASAGNISVNAALSATGNVLLDAQGAGANVAVTANIIKSAGAAASLDIRAGNNITLSGAVGSTTGNLSVLLTPGGGSGVGVATNQGTLDLSGGTVSGSLVNQGALNVATGNASVTGGLSMQSGAINVTTGQTLTVGGPGLDWQGGSLLGVSASSYSLAALTFSGAGARVLNGPTFNIANLNLPAGSLSVQSGALNLSGASSIASGASMLLNGGSFAATGTLANAGTLAKASTGTTTIAAALNNTGAVNANAGVINFAGGYAQSAGSLLLAGGNVSAPLGLTLNGGVLGGGGTVTGNVANVAGTVAPGLSPGILTIAGNYTQGAGGTLSIEIGGTAAGTQYDQLIVTGNASLAGTFNSMFYGGYVPAGGEVFNVVRAGGVLSGTFATVTTPAGVTGTYLPGGFDLTASAVFSPFDVASTLITLQQYQGETISDASPDATADASDTQKAQICR